MQLAYDVMDVDVPQFQADFTTFKHAIRELEHRLGALIVQVRQPCCFTHQSPALCTGSVVMHTCISGSTRPTVFWAMLHHAGL